jgi:predicted MFS family arabinose efflux permease
MGSVDGRETPGLSPLKVGIFAVASGATVANIAYAQPILGLIAPDLHISEGTAGTIVMLTQLGYGAGLFFITSMADLFENRRLVLVTTAGAALGLAGAAASTSVVTFLLSCLVVGICSVGAQIIIPMAASVTPEKVRGRVIGNIMAGLIGGIMVARPISSFLAGHFGWRSVFWFSACLMLATWLLLSVALQKRRPASKLRYSEILKSTVTLFRSKKSLRHRILYQGCLFVAFSMFWTAAPLMLRDRFGLSQQGIALFALAGAGGTLAAPIAGRLADRGLTQATTRFVMVIGVLSCLAAGWSSAIGSMAALVVSALALDAATQANQIVGQRVIYGLAPEARGRTTAIYMSLILTSGGMGSVAGTYIYAAGGWWPTAIVASLVVLVAAVFHEVQIRFASRPVTASLA